MADEIALLKAVLSGPDEDAPRLSFAEWCEGRSEPTTRARGDFIRTQLSLANLDVTAHPREEYSLRYQSEKLDRRHHQDWGGEVGALVEEYRFDRGFVEFVGLPAEEFLELASGVFALAPIRHLRLTEVTHVAGVLFDSPHLSAIRSLDLSRCGLADSEVAQLAASPYLTELRWLSLAENEVGVAGAGALAASFSLPHLRYVNFRGNRFEPNLRHTFDGGDVIDSWLPDDGIALEEQYGRLPWLRHAATGVMDTIPNRFRLGT